MKYSTEKGVDGLRDCLRIRNKKEKEIGRLETYFRKNPKTYMESWRDIESERETDRKTDIP